MTAFISSLSDLVTVFFNMLRLQSLLPATVFSVANVALVLPHLRNNWVGNLYYTMPETERLLCVMLFTIFLAYFLNIVNFSLIRWLEGYPWLQSKIGQHRRNKYCEHYDKLKPLYESRPSIFGPFSTNTLGPQQAIPNTNPNNTVNQALVIQEFTTCYPAEKSQILPTRFGNIIASAEDYPKQMYGMDAVALWRLLSPILAKTGYVRFIEYEKAALDFMLNSLVLLPVLGIELLICGILSKVSFLYTAAESLAIIIACTLLYELSLSGAMGWGITIRTAFDLHRDELRRAANLKESDCFMQEQARWEIFSEFIAYRDANIGRSDLFNYPMYKGYGAVVFSQSSDTHS